MYNVAVHVLRMMLSLGFLPMLHAQNREVMYDFPALGGIDTLNERILSSSISWNALAITFINGRASKNS